LSIEEVWDTVRACIKEEGIKKGMEIKGAAARAEAKATRKKK